MDLQIKSSRVVLATESAVRKLKELKEAESTDSSFLRMGVKPGGCSGLSYEMFFDTEKSENEIKHDALISDFIGFEKVIEKYL